MQFTITNLHLKTQTVELKKNDLRSAEFSKFVTLYFYDLRSAQVFDLFLTSYEMSTYERPCTLKDKGPLTRSSVFRGKKRCKNVLFEMNRISIEFGYKV
jgi:hypothetical protein